MASLGADHQKRQLQRTPNRCNCVTIIAAYLPKEIDEKFQVFKQEREVGDSQALILLMSEYFGVSQQATYSSDSLLVKQVEELSSLLNELKSELATKVGEERISELKSELLSELKVSSSNSESRGEPEKQLDIGVEVAQVQKKPTKPRARKKPTKSSDSKDVADGINILTTTQLAQRLDGVKNNNGISSAKHSATELAVVTSSRVARSVGVPIFPSAWSQVLAVA